MSIYFSCEVFDVMLKGLLQVKAENGGSYGLWKIVVSVSAGRRDTYP